MKIILIQVEVNQSGVRYKTYIISSTYATDPIIPEKMVYDRMMKFWGDKTKFDGGFYSDPETKSTATVRQYFDVNDAELSVLRKFDIA